MGILNEAARRGCTEELLGYLRENPGISNRTLVAAGYGNHLRVLYHSNINAARADAGVPLRYARKTRQERRNRVIAYLREHPDADRDDTVAAGLYTDIMAAFRGNMTDARQAAGVDRVEERRARLLAYLRAHPDAQRQDLPKQHRIDLHVAYDRRFDEARQDIGRDAIIKEQHREALHAYLHEHPSPDYRELAHASLRDALNDAYGGDLRTALADAGLPDTRPYIPLMEAADLLGATKQWMHLLAQNHAVRHYRVGSRIFISKDDVLRRKSRKQAVQRQTPEERRVALRAYLQAHPDAPFSRLPGDLHYAVQALYRTFNAAREDAGTLRAAERGRELRSYLRAHPHARKQELPADQLVNLAVAYSGRIGEARLEAGLIHEHPADPELAAATQNLVAMAYAHPGSLQALDARLRERAARAHK